MCVGGTAATWDCVPVDVREPTPVGVISDVEAKLRVDFPCSSHGIVLRLSHVSMASLLLFASLQLSHSLFPNGFV